MKNFRFFLILISLLTCTSAYSQNTGSFVSGVVVTPDKEPLENVSVAIEGTTNGALTDKDGKFRFSAPVGEYTLVVSSIEHKPYKKTVVLKRGENQFNVVLSTSDNELQEVTVVSEVAKFANKESDYIARMPIKYLENPQVYSVIGKDLIKEQVIVNFDDALKNTPGLDKLWSSTGRGGDGAAYFSLRGFSTQPNMVNGLGGQTNSGLDAANIERIEVLKGPSGTLFGSSLVSFGGLINVVTKKPFERTSSEVSLTAGNFGLNRISADINTPLDKEGKVLLRTNAAYQYEGSFQDAGFKRTFFLAPSLTYKASDRLTFNINTEFYSSEGTNPLMIFLNRGRQLESRTPKELGMDYKRSFTSNDITVKNPTVKMYGTMDYKISDQWVSQSAISYSSRKSDGLYSYVMFQGEHDDYLTRSVGAINGTTSTIDIQQNFIGDFKIGNLRNRLVVGLDYFSSSDNSTSSYIDFDTINSRQPASKYGIMTKAAIEARLGEEGVRAYPSITDTRIYSTYFSDVLNVTDRLLLMASLRLDYFDNKGSLDVLSRTRSGQYNQTALSPKFGAVYQILPEKLSVFANYMNGFQNVGSSTQPDGSVRTFKPQQANQMEGGIKATLFDGKLVGSISYYDIYVTKVTRPDPNQVGFTIQDGDVYSRGVELDITANPLPGLTIIAGYSHNDSENKKTDETELGRRPVGAGPADLVNGWLSYTIQAGAVKGLGFGFGGNYAGENAITNSSTTGKFIIPAYTILNATAFYNTGAFRFALKVDNLTNKEYWKGWTTVEPQKLRQIIGNVTFHF